MARRATTPLRRAGGLTAREWEALSPTERRQRGQERPAFHHSFAPSQGGLWRPVMEVTDARGLTLHATTVQRDEIPELLRWLVATFLR